MRPEGEEMVDREEAHGSDGASQWPNAVTFVLAGASARQKRWAVDTAIHVTRQLASSHSKVILADLQRAQPSPVVDALGIDAGAGIVDVLFRGASFSAVARRPEGESFFVLPLGEDPPAGVVLLQHGRWRKIAARLPGAEAHLLPCVTAEDWLEAGPIPGFEACIVLNGLGYEVELPSGAHQLAEFLAPPEIREGPAPTLEVEPPQVESEEAEPERPEDLEEEPAEDAIRAPAPDQAESVAVEGSYVDLTPSGVAGPAAVDRPGAAVERPVEAPASWSEPAAGGGSMDDGGADSASAGFSARRGPDRRGLLAGAAAVIIVVALLAAWQLTGGPDGASEPPPLEAAGPLEDTLPAERAGEPKPDADTEAAAEAEGQAPVLEAAAGEERPETTSVETEPLPYSVAIASYSSFEDAVQRQSRWASDEVRFYVAPTIVRGVVYYRVFAGLLADRQEAEELMAELVRAGIKDTVRGWDVRPTRLAFSFGTYSTEREARSSAETLEARGIPAYVVEVPGAAASGVGYRVYAGGYERAEDARPLRDRIAEAGLDVELVERVGMVPR